MLLQARSLILTQLLRRSLIVTLAVSLLTGCVLTDEFRERADEYNYQAAATKRSVILTNILRSTYTLPLQFTDISTVTGQSGATAGLGASFPFDLGGSPNLLGNFNPSGQLSGNSTFGVTNLNTQEFYNGLQSPISKQFIALSLRSGFPARVLLPLVISEIEIVHRGRRIRLINSPSNPDAFRTFNSALQVLIVRGLTTEEISNVSRLGPVLSAEQAADPRLQAQIVTAAADAPTLEPVGEGFQLQKRSKSSSFCFDPLRFSGGGRYSGQGVLVGPAKLADRVEAIPLPLVTAFGQDFSDAALLVDPAKLCGNADRKTATGDDRIGKQQLGLNLSVTTRSLQGIFAYLGEIVRTNLAAGDGDAPPLELRDFDGSFYQLFRLERRPPLGNDIGLFFEGSPYAMRIDPTGADASSRVLQLLTDLLALNSSAKNLPSPTVISVISQ